MIYNNYYAVYVSNLHYVTVKENSQNAKDMSGKNNPMYGKNAWAIACSRKAPEEIKATLDSKAEKMKKFWSENPEALKQMSENVKRAKRKEVIRDGRSL